MFEGPSEQGPRPELEAMTIREGQSTDSERSALLDAEVGERVDLESSTDTESENVSEEKPTLDAVRGNYFESQ
jgi:hypothetical protein